MRWWCTKQKSLVLASRINIPFISCHYTPNCFNFFIFTWLLFFVFINKYLCHWFLTHFWKKITDHFVRNAFWNFGIISGRVRTSFSLDFRYLNKWKKFQNWRRRRRKIGINWVYWFDTAKMFILPYFFIGRLHFFEILKVKFIRSS